MRFAPAERLDRYEIVEVLGEGAFSEAYEARDTETGNLVVLKVPHPAILGDPSIFDRFRREMSIAQRLDHPGIQRSLDAGATRSVAYMVFEFIDGENLRSWLKEHQPVSIHQTVDFARQLADAFEYIHGQGVVHRDVKPENILVTRDTELKLADFGIALAAGARRLTWRHLSEGLGTPDYMAPEQIQGERGDARTDLYALGILLYEMTTARIPYGGDNYLAVMNQHMNALPVRPSKLRRDLPRTLEAIILKLMRKRPDDRYQSASELKHDLAHWESLDPESLGPLDDHPLHRRTPNSTRSLVLLIAGIAGGFLLAVTLAILITVALR